MVAAMADGELLAGPWELRPEKVDMIRVLYSPNDPWHLAVAKLFHHSKVRIPAELRGAREVI